jgi:nitroimidazol reductase NimA-like FMN-containing flavoprotein (pyridoxamine 5'-phosphate oxidase superfamily)
MESMRKHRQEIKDRGILEQILSNQVICRLAMLDGKRPYIVPVNYGYRQGCLYIHSAPEGKKIDLLRQDPGVCFEVEEPVEIIKGDRACNWSTRYRSVVGYGSVEILSDEISKRQGLEVLMAQHGAPGLKEFDTAYLKRMVILKLRITSLSGKKSSNE